MTTLCRSSFLLFVSFLVVACGGDPDTSVDASMDAAPVARPDAQTASDASGADACVPQIEICGDRIDQNCDGRDQGCGDADGDRFNACRAGDDLSTCDCDDDQVTAYPGHPEECDGIDNDCNGRIDEIPECCAACSGIEASRADICLEDGSCDCEAEPGIGPCDTGSVCCGGGCTDTDTDVAHCGFCGRACDGSSDSCTAGECGCGTGPVCDFVYECVGGACQS